MKENSVLAQFYIHVSVTDVITRSERDISDRVGKLLDYQLELDRD